MEVSSKRVNALFEGLKVSSAELHIISPEGLSLLRLTKLSLEGLNVSLGGIKLK